MEETLPIRLIICVDGTWCDPDGAHGNRNHNITNVYRLYTSIQKGECKSSSGKRFLQVKKYFPGIAAGDGIRHSKRLIAGMFGGPCIDLIRDVYEYCCQTAGQNDEVWFYGFSRGAYIVRAVAGLLHYIRAIASAGQQSFKEDFKSALKIYKKMQEQNKLGEGQIHQMFEAGTNPPPVIQFVGIFDTVKAVKDQRLYNISFNLSIQHLRHALALNEDRQRFEPEYIYPDFNDRTQNLLRRTFIQAWFIGSHIDIGGSSDKDGLSLYPLQWMLLESREQGLCLQFDGNFGGRTTLTSPLQITGLEGDHNNWVYETENGIRTEMQDIRNIHQNEVNKGKHGIHLHASQSGFWIRSPREPFGEDGDLNGYCSFGAQGTIIHPSVYLLLDRFMHVSLNAKHFPFYQFLQQWRSKALGSRNNEFNGCFWNDSSDTTELDDPGAIRLLVCGNAGVGKSSLINKVFGVEVTTVSHRTRGIHQIKDEITWKDRPDLIIHDSRGFEAGSEDELSCVKDFLKCKSAETDIEKRLHVIWYCLEVKTCRTQQVAQEGLFKCLSEYAQDVPIVVVATKKDEFLGVKVQEARDKIPSVKTFEDADAYAEDKLRLELNLIHEELAQITRFDDLVAISLNDDESVGNLTLATEKLFTHERVRLLYIRAQATRLDLKIGLAWTEAMKTYRRVLISSSMLTALPLAPSTNRTAAAIDVCRAIVSSFGIPMISPETIYQICKANLWDDASNSIYIACAEISAMAGLGATILAGGLPFFLIPMVANLPAVVVPTSRLIVMLSCDIILILTRAFRVATIKSITKPEKKDVEDAAIEYRKHCREIHRRVKDRISNVVACYKVGRVEGLVSEIIEEFKCKVLEGVGAGLPPDFKRDFPRKNVSSWSLDDDSSSVKDTYG